MRFETTYPFHLEPLRVSGGEYLPDGANPQFIDKNKDKVLINNPEVEIVSRKRGFLSFQFEYESKNLIDKQVEFEVPLLYYTGYQGTLTTKDGAIIPLETFHSPNGFIGVIVSDAPDGKIEVHYQKTTMQWIGDLITLSAIMIYFWIFIKSQKTTPLSKINIKECGFNSSRRLKQ